MKSVSFLRTHIDESLIYNYAHLRDPKELKKSLKYWFGYQEDITLTITRDERQSLKFQNFNKVIKYSFIVLNFVAKLR